MSRVVPQLLKSKCKIIKKIINCCSVKQTDEVIYIEYRIAFGYNSLSTWGY